jgi:hypothetical protein
MVIGQSREVEDLSGLQLYVVGSIYALPSDVPNGMLQWSPSTNFYSLQTFTVKLLEWL